MGDAIILNKQETARDRVVAARVFSKAKAQSRSDRVLSLRKIDI